MERDEEEGGILELLVKKKKVVGYQRHGMITQEEERNMKDLRNRENFKA